MVFLSHRVLPGNEISEHRAYWQEHYLIIHAGYLTRKYKDTLEHSPLHIAHSGVARILTKGGGASLHAKNFEMQATPTN